MSTLSLWTALLCVPANTWMQLTAWCHTSWEVANHWEEKSNYSLETFEESHLLLQVCYAHKSLLHASKHLHSTDNFVLCTLRKICNWQRSEKIQMLTPTTSLLRIFILHLVQPGSHVKKGRESFSPLQLPSNWMSSDSVKQYSRPTESNYKFDDWITRRTILTTKSAELQKLKKIAWACTQGGLRMFTRADIV